MIESQETKTVFALASGKGVSGVSIIRISGPLSKLVLNELVGFLPEPRSASLCKIQCAGSGEVIDHGLVLWFPGPASYTGEDVVEFHVHGSPAVISLLFKELSNIGGLAPAEPGVFTKRAFLNGKMDLTETEGLADLIHAETEYQRQQAIKQYEGLGSKQYLKWRKELKESLAYLEAFIDFADEDLDEKTEYMVNQQIQKLIEEMEEKIQSANFGERLRNGFHIVLAGDVNVGKSTLLNSLAKRDVAIVSNTPGTTRDVIEAHLNLGGMPVIVSDTAGFRETTGEIEIEGIKRTRDKILKADLVLMIKDGFSRKTNTICSKSFPKNKTIIVWNKIDLGKIDRGNEEFQISSRTGEGLENLLDFIHKRASEGSIKGINSIVIRERHRISLSACIDNLKESRRFSDSQLDLKVEMLRSAMNQLGNIVGKVGVEDILDSIFSDFCIGK